MMNHSWSLIYLEYSRVIHYPNDMKEVGPTHLSSDQHIKLVDEDAVSRTILL